MAIEFTHEAGRIGVDEVWRQLRESYWSPRIRREVVESAIRHSVVVGALERGPGGGGGARLVGFARMVTDRATFAWVCDVIVVEDRRGSGIGREMVRRLMGLPEVRTVRRFCLATRDAHGVYAPLGFSAVDAGRWMERKPDASAWQEGEGR